MLVHGQKAGGHGRIRTEQVRANTDDRVASEPRPSPFTRSVIARARAECNVNEELIVHTERKKTTTNLFRNEIKNS